MAGQIEQGRLRQIGAGKSGSLGITDGDRALLIFKDPLFDPNLHQIRNKETVPGWGAGSFAGLDSFGWGVHPTGVVDCVNMPMCTHGFGTSGSINFTNFWRLEASEQEVFLVNRKQPDGYRMFLDRMIVQVRLDASSVQMIPDPTVWVVAVPRAGSETSVPAGTTGRLVLRSAPTPETEKIRFGTYSLRDVNIEFTGTGRNQGWPTNKSPAR